MSKAKLLDMVGSVGGNSAKRLSELEDAGLDSSELVSLLFSDDPPPQAKSRTRRLRLRYFMGL